MKDPIDLSQWTDAEIETEIRSSMRMALQNLSSASKTRLKLARAQFLLMAEQNIIRAHYLAKAQNRRNAREGNE